jgi:hypothetical protein
MKPAAPKETPSQKADRIYAEQHPEKPAKRCAQHYGHANVSRCGLTQGHAGEHTSQFEAASEVPRLLIDPNHDSCRESTKTQATRIRELLAALKKAEEERETWKNADISRTLRAHTEHEAEGLAAMLTTTMHRADAAEEALYVCYQYSGADAGDKDDFHALVNKTEAVPEAVLNMRGRWDAAEAKLKKAEEERDEAQRAKYGTPYSCEACDLAEEQRDAAEAHIETLEKIIGDAPHGTPCHSQKARCKKPDNHRGKCQGALGPCDCWKAAAALKEKP